MAADCYYSKVGMLCGVLWLAVGVRPTRWEETSLDLMSAGRKDPLSSCLLKEPKAYMSLLHGPEPNQLSHNIGMDLSL